MPDNIIQPRILKGFRDFLPEDEAVRKYIQRLLEDAFEAFGFSPIDTPVLEYTDVLLGKGGGETDKQVYRFLDNGKRDVSMRFDLTVPFARFVAAHLSELTLPFKRYHISKVWRGENTQRGRYREFMQCDFDIVGTDSVSSDFEILEVMYASLEKIIGKGFNIHISHRGLLNRFLDSIGLLGQSVTVLRSIDKVSKLGKEKVLEQLSNLGEKDRSEDILSFIEPAEDNLQTLKKMEVFSGGPSEDSLRIQKILTFADETGIADSVILDPGITRGLDYYTGIVFETFLEDLPGLGSVCSGGRYNNLASLYTSKDIPGVGSSIGLDRLLTGLSELKKIDSHHPQADVLVMDLDDELTGYYHALAADMRKEGIRCDVFHEKKKLGAQFNYAEKKNISLAVICGEDEKARGVVTVKDLAARKNYEDITPASLAVKIQDLLKELKPGRPINS